MYKHVKDQLFLSVYVDDFKMAGNKSTLKPMWEKIGKRIKLEESVPLDGNVYLGCGQHNVKTNLKLLKEKEEFWKDLNTVRPHEVVPESDQTGTEDQATDSCPKKAGKRKVKAKAKAKAKPTKAKKSGSCSIIMQPLPSMPPTSPADKSHVKSYEYDMCGHADQCVERYLDLSGEKRSSLKQVSTPCIDDHQLPPEDFQVKGKLKEVCARIVLKVLFLARIKRADL